MILALTVTSSWFVVKISVIMSLEWDQITYTTSKGLVLRAVGVEGHGLAIVRVVPVVTNAGLLQHIMIITLAWGTIIFLSSTFEGVVVVIA